MSEKHDYSIMMLLYLDSGYRIRNSRLNLAIYKILNMQ